jgi:RNA polymerase sigma-70 factor (ECF subfamily)
MGCDASPDGRVVQDVDADEGTLTRAAADGDHEAFRTLVDRHYDPALRYALRMLGHRADAEDAVQDAFVRVYRSLPRYRHEGQFRAWVFRILVNRCRTAATGRRRRQSILAPAEARPDRSHGVESPKQGEPFKLAAIERALAGLPVALREAFLLKYVEELTYDEMADVTGASVSALKMRVSRARQSLRAQLQEMRE